MTQTVSPMSVRQWKDEEHPQAKDDDTNNHIDSHNNDNNNDMPFHVNAAQCILLQEIIPIYAEMAYFFSTHSMVEAKHLSKLLEQLQALSSFLHIDLAQAIRNKIRLNGRKYPVEQAKGKMSKYTEYSQTTGITKQEGQSTLDFPNVYTGQETTAAELRQLQSEIRDFAAQRDWGPFHTPRNLCLALGGELGELVEQLFLMETLQTDKLYQEVADVTIYLLRLADVCQLSLFDDTSASDSSALATVRSFPVVPSSQQQIIRAPATVHYPVGLIRDHILQLWIHWARQDMERFHETLQRICFLLNCPNTTPASGCSDSTTSRLSILCLLGSCRTSSSFGRQQTAAAQTRDDLQLCTTDGEILQRRRRRHPTTAMNGAAMNLTIPCKPIVLR